MYRSLGHVYFLPLLQGKEKNSVIKKTDIAVVQLRYFIDRGWFDKMPNLKVIATNTTGLNHIDIREAKKRGVKIISLRGRTNFLKDIPSTAEKTMALLLALVRNLPWAFDHVKGGGWKRTLFTGNQLYTKTLGIVGFGRLGKIVARYARTFGMNIIAYDPYLAEGIFKSRGVRRMTSLGALMKASDIVSLHPTLHIDREKKGGKIFEKNVGMIQERHFKAMKSSAFLVNTSRGEIIDEKALLKALKQKWIKGAALDVLWNESGDGAHLKSNPLVTYARKNKNLIIVPHIGGATYEALEMTQNFIAALVGRYVRK